MSKFTTKLRKNRFISGVFTIGLGNFIAQLISVATILVISRLYNQETYGEYGIIISTATIITSFSTLGLTSAIMTPDNENEGRLVLLTAFYIQITMSLLCYIIILIIEPYYLLYKIKGSYYFSLMLMFIYIFFNNVRILIYTYVNRIGLNRVLMINPIIRSIAIMLISVAMGLLSANYFGLLFAVITAEILTSIQMIVRVNPFKQKYCHSDFIFIIKNIAVTYFFCALRI